MELAELMKSFQESMRAARKDSEARAGAAGPPAGGGKAKAKAVAKRKASAPKAAQVKSPPCTPPVNRGKCKGDHSLTPETPPATPPRRRLRRATAEDPGIKEVLKDPKALPPQPKKRPAAATPPAPTKRSARLANVAPMVPPDSEKLSTKKMQVTSPVALEKSQVVIPKPFEKSTRKVVKADVASDASQSPMEKSQVSAASPAPSTTSAASQILAAEREDQEPVASVRGSWWKLQELLRQLPKRHDLLFGGEALVGRLLEAAAGCCQNDLDLKTGHAQLTATNALLDLAAALICDGSGELAPIMTVAIATRGVLNLVAQRQGSVGLWCLDLEPVPAPEHLTNFAGQLEELVAKSRLQLSSWEMMRKCYSLAMNRDDGHDPRNLEVAICRPAACAALALGRTLALEACEAQRQTLAQLEARARVRRASKEAAEEETQRLRREARSGAAVLEAAADETQKQVKELQKLNEEMDQGRHILQSWTSMLKVQHVPAEMWGGRPPDVSTADWARMNAGQHLNDSLIDLFVSMLVGLLGGSRTHAFSSHFYARLAGSEDEQEQRLSSDQGWQRVRTWTRTVRRRHVTGIFACDYLLVPLHHEEEHHWSLAVVCRPWAAIDGLENWANVSTTTVVFLDSLLSSSSRTRQEAVVRNLCQYLECEWRVCGAVGTFESSRVKAVPVDVPQQTNNFDCGIYVLEFVLQLLQHPWRLAALGQRPVTFEVHQEEARQRWHDAAMKLRHMKEAAPDGGAESAWFAARLWLQVLQAPPES